MADETKKKDEKTGGKDTASGAKPTPPAGTPAAPGKTGLGFGVWFIVLLLIALGIGYLSWPLWKDPALSALHQKLPPALAGLLPAPATEAPVAPVIVMDGTVPAPAPTPSPATIPSPGTDIAARMGTLERVLADMDMRLRARPTGDGTGNGTSGVDLTPVLNELAALRTRLDALEARTPGGAELTGTRLLLLGQIQTALIAGAPYGDALRAFTRHLDGDAVLLDLASPLKADAETGIATHAELKARFPDLAGAITRALRTEALMTPESEGNVAVPGWLARAWEKVSALVVIRRVGAPPDASGAAALLARAEAALEADDLEGAVLALDGLESTARDTATPWVEDARHRLDGLAALAQLQTEMLSRVQTRDTGGGN